MIGHYLLFPAKNRIIYSIVNRIREKIELNPKEPDYIKVVWGAGCRFRGQP